MARPGRAEIVAVRESHRLHGFEMRAKSDGHMDRREREIMRTLVRDLDRTCGRYRWHG